MPSSSPSGRTASPPRFGTTRRLARRPEAHQQKSFRVCRRLWHAWASGRPEGNRAGARFRLCARARDGGTTFTRKAEAQLLAELALLSQDLARFAADILLFYTQEFAYVALPEAFTTGSSIMPQKRNPDVFELVRAAPQPFRPA